GGTQAGAQQQGGGEPRHPGPAGEAEVGRGEAGRALVGAAEGSGVHDRTLTDRAGFRAPARGRGGWVARGLAYTRSAYRRASGGARRLSSVGQSGALVKHRSSVRFRQ